MTTIDAIADVLHAAGVYPGFTYDPATDAAVATVKCGNLGGPDFYWASCRPCWWWGEDDDNRPLFTRPEAQTMADAHNAAHHPQGAPA